jgi:hypothetical protein
MYHNTTIYEAAKQKTHRIGPCGVPGQGLESEDQLSNAYSLNRELYRRRTQ